MSPLQAIALGIEALSLTSAKILDAAHVKLAGWMVPFGAMFTAPTWQHVLMLLVGAVLSPKQRTVAAALRVTGLDQNPHFTTYHRVRLCCSNQRAGRTMPFLGLVSRYPDVLRASKVNHAVQRTDGDGHLGRPTPIRAGAQAVVNHPLELAGVGLDQGAPAMARGCLPAHVAPFLQEPRVTVALRRRDLGRSARRRVGSRRHVHDSVGMTRGDLVGDAVPIVGAVGG